MGVAVRPDGESLAVAVDAQIWQFRNVPALAGRLDPPGTYDACYLPRQAVYTGPIDAHEMAWCGGDLWVVNTLVLLPVHARRRPQLRAEVEAAVRLGAGGRGSLPSQRVGLGRTGGPAMSRRWARRTRRKAGGPARRRAAA